MVVYAIVRSVRHWRNRSTATRLSSWTSILAILLLFPSLWLIAAWERNGLAIPKPGLPDPASGEAVMFVLLGLLMAYLLAFAVVRAINQLS
jgi:hypothetical protein